MDTNPVPKKDSPKKYIRTLEGDMETLKRGGVPDLAPLAETPPVSAPVEPLAHAVPAPVESASLPVQVEIKTPPPPLPTPPPPPAPLPTPPEPEPLPAVAPPVVPVQSTPIETYEGDFLDRMKDTHASTATVLAVEQDSLQGAPHAAPQVPPRNNLPYIIAGTLLLIAGVAGVSAAYIYHMKITAPVVFTPSAPAPIFVDDREQISGTGPVLLQAIEESVTRPLAVGTVRLLYTASSTDTESVFSALDMPAPDILLRNVQAAGSMAGVVNVGGEQSPFFILSVLSYSDTFSGMLSWEPHMVNDLAALFPPYQATSTAVAATTQAPSLLKTTLFFGERGSEVEALQQVLVQDGFLHVSPTGYYGSLTRKAVGEFQSAHGIVPLVGASETAGYGTVGPKTLAEINTLSAATTTAATSSTTTPTAFADETVANHDVRIYRDASGQSILLYGYWNQTTLVIARDPAAFTEILQRLATSQTQ